MCQSCPFNPQTNKREYTALIKQIDAVISFQGKKINTVHITPKQYKILESALADKDVDFHTPLRRHGVALIKMGDV